MSKDKEIEPVRSSPDLFLETLRKTLEHIADDVWLDKNSPLSSVFFAGPILGAEKRGRLHKSGRSDIDQKLEDLWSIWTEIPKNRLQALIWEAIGLLGFESGLDNQPQTVLLLTYFDLEQPKQSEVVKTLAVGRSTYYRYLERAVETLGIEIVKNLRPALKIEQPSPRPLVGRDRERYQAIHKLEQGGIVHLVGGGGLGKTSLGAAVASNWKHGVFWYSFQPKLTDSLEQLIFALGFFLHQRGASDLWLYLSGRTDPPQPKQTLMILQQHLELLQDHPPLFCFDEIDLLLPDEVHDSEATIQLRGFLNEWSQMDRYGSPMLLMGQKILFEPEPNGLIQLSPIPQDEIGPFMTHLGADVSPEASLELHRLTRGNPLLLRLFGILQQQKMPISETMEQLTSSITLEWFWRSLHSRLAKTEVAILQSLSVFPTGGPKDSWRNYPKQIDQLIDQGLLEESSEGTIAILPVLRQVIYDQLPLMIRKDLHIQAGNLLAERSRFTTAAYHYIQGEEPELAIWTWYTHRAIEVNQGQTSFATSIFSPLLGSTLATSDDEKALALIIAQLSAFNGSMSVGLQALDNVSWPENHMSSAMAQELSAWLLSDSGQVKKALEEYRKSLEAVENISVTQEVNLRMNIARRAYIHLSDIQQANREIALARFDLNILQGQLEDATGNYTNARLHYANALAGAKEITTPSKLVQLYEALGVMEARYAHVEAAVKHFKKAGELHRKTGNTVCAVGVTNSNISYAYLTKRQYEKAIEPAEISYEFYKTINHSYWLAINEANLAEACFYLGRHAEAEEYAQAGLMREEPAVRPYCLYILGHLSRTKMEFSKAEKFCLQAIGSAQQNKDPWGEAPAYIALGETLRDDGKRERAREAIEKALAIWKQVNIEHEIEHTQHILDQI